MVARLLYCVVCVLAGFMPLALSDGPRVGATEGFPGWPAEYEGRALHQRPLDPREAAFLADFPGEVGCFDDGERQLVLRWISAPSHRLHPARACFAGRGFEITPEADHIDPGGARWGRFVASRDGERLRVSERLFDGRGKEWSDVSAWYWEQLLSPSSGPWWAWMIVEACPRSDEEALVD